MTDDEASPEKGPQVAASTSDQSVEPQESLPAKIAEAVAPAANLLKQVDVPKGPVIIRRVVWSVIIVIAGALGTALFSLIWQRFSPQIIDCEMDVRQDSSKGKPVPTST